MRVLPCGDACYIVAELGDQPAFAWAEAIADLGILGVNECSASYETVGVYVNPAVFEPQRLLDALAQLDLTTQPKQPRLVRIPVCYELGEDTAEVAAKLGMTPEEVAAEHSGVDYDCFAIGFCPGFTYLGPLPPRLQGLPRKPQPRVRIVPGSVAITGKQTGVYPLERPGGWELIGRTPVEMVNVEDGYFPINPGDQIRFVPIDAETFERLKGRRLPLETW